jgi:hypothetical protein
VEQFGINLPEKVSKIGKQYARKNHEFDCWRKNATGLGDGGAKSHAKITMNCRENFTGIDKKARE